jgi:hypothetical protein
VQSRLPLATRNSRLLLPARDIGALEGECAQGHGDAVLEGLGIDRGLGAPLLAAEGAPEKLPPSR